MWGWGLRDGEKRSAVGPITATGDHPFWVKGKGWTPLNEVLSGDEMETCDPDYDTVLVNTVERHHSLHEVYNIEVEEFNTFFLARGGLWVHNCNTTGTKVTVD